MVDAAGKRAYVAGASGGVDVIELETGKVLWSIKEKVVPLALVGDRLLSVPYKPGVKADVVLIFDVTREGEKPLECKTPDLPDWRAALYMRQSQGRALNAQVVATGDAVYFRWSPEAWVFGKSPPLRDPADQNRTAGLARVNVRTGAVEKAEKLPEVGPRVPEEVARAAGRDVLFGWGKEKMVRTAGGVAYAVDNEVVDRKIKVTLKRWELATGKELEPILLVQTNAVSAGPTLDGRYITITVNPGLAPGQKENECWIVDPETGKDVAKFSYEPPANHPTVVGNRLYYVSGAQLKTPMANAKSYFLRAVDLTTGKLVWEREIDPDRWWNMP